MRYLLRIFLKKKKIMFEEKFFLLNNNIIKFLITKTVPQCAPLYQRFFASNEKEEANGGRYRLKVKVTKVDEKKRSQFGSATLCTITSFPRKCRISFVRGAGVTALRDSKEPEVSGR